MKRQQYVVRIIYKNSPEKGQYFMAHGYAKYIQNALHLTKEEWDIWFQDMDKKVVRKMPLSQLVKLVPLQ